MTFTSCTVSDTLMASPTDLKPAVLD